MFVTAERGFLPGTGKETGCPALFTMTVLLALCLCPLRQSPPSSTGSHHLQLRQVSTETCLSMREGTVVRTPHVLSGTDGIEAGSTMEQSKCSWE